MLYFDRFSAKLVKNTLFFDFGDFLYYYLDKYRCIVGQWPIFISFYKLFLELVRLCQVLGKIEH